MNSRNRILTTLVAFFSLAVAGCSGTEVSPGDTKKSESTDISTAGTFPIVKEPITIKVMVKANALVEDFATNRFSKWMEEKTNINVQWEVIPEKAAQEKLNLALASGDYPDVIMGFGVSPAQQLIYGDQGVFLSLNNYIDKFGVETKKMIQENPYVRDLISTPNGKIYSLPQVNQCFHCSYPQKMWIYKPWLDKLGLKMPTTTEEFYTVLKAFKENDPNGNGKPDEIPLAGAINAKVDEFLMNSFLYNDKSHLFLNNGKVEVTFNKPEWKEGLTYLQRLYAEKLLSPQTFTQDNNQLKQMGENPDVPILGAATAQNMGVLTQFFGKSGRWLEYVAVQPLKGPGGRQIAALNPWGLVGGTFIITNKSKNPEAVFRWADTMFNREVTLNSVFGRPEQEWRWANQDEIGINGKTAIWKRLANFGQIQNIHWAQTGPSYRPNDLRLGEAVEKDMVSQETILYKESKEKYEPYQIKAENIVPPLFFTSEQASEIADLEKTIGDYVNEMLTRFVTGDANISTEWDSYLKTLDGMNVKRYIQVYQDAYDAKYKKK
ncbi:ABC transporter substrate-binding protein [Paenibacillus aceris]|uniref:Aldouronate transport system substrate-binding protein n=1 Tax=Paenibacillus aceris TaxID=869555 RepID=A0ABS4HQZ2_9BACL|nr:ABC transporter substrate-binding protein [Paenibacillus aceris]MBP1960821.1 putative aldouronate transport system substrate-binding protein [Paenibacillus aceris]NHW35500.1 extracellular solute-binding protein [Paenibacillus aceris]